ncbi:MAG: DUF4870 domain-containing protein [Candidatus Taylorbacteria bacterium]
MDQQTPNIPNATQQNSPAPQMGSGGNAMAVFCYLGILIIIPFLTDGKNDPFVKFHIKQGLVLIISFVVGMAIGIIPILGWIVGGLLLLFNVVMVILGIVNVLSGKKKELPLIGKYASKFNF